MRVTNSDRRRRYQTGSLEAVGMIVHGSGQIIHEIADAAQGLSLKELRNEANLSQAAIIQANAELVAAQAEMEKVKAGASTPLPSTGVMGGQAGIMWGVLGVGAVIGLIFILRR